MIYTKIEENYDVKLAASNIDILLENKLGKDSISVRTLNDSMESLNNILSIIKMTLGGIAIVSLIVGALGIINTMYVIVTEKTKEIGKEDIVKHEIIVKFNCYYDKNTLPKGA